MVSSQRNLLASTDVVSAELESRFAGDFVDRDSNMRKHFTIVSISSSRCINVRSPNHICSGGGRRDNNGRSIITNGRTILPIITGASHSTPLIVNILIIPTSKLGIENDRLALTDFYRISHNLEFSTELIDRKVGGGHAVREGLRDGGGIDARSLGLQFKASTSLRTSPFNRVIRVHERIGVVFGNQVRGKGSAVTVANHVVTRNGNLGHSVHFRFLLSNLNSGSAAHIVVRFRRDNVRALAKQVQREVGQVLSRNLHTVKIPSDIGGTHGNGHHLITNAHVFRRGNRNTGQLGAGQLGNIDGIGNRASRSKRVVIDASGMSRNGNGDIRRAHRQTNG